MIDNSKNYDAAFFVSLEKFLSAKSGNLIADFPIIRIQLGYFLGLLKMNKVETGSLHKMPRYDRLTFTFQDFKQLIKLRARLILNYFNHKKLLNGKVLLYGYTSHYAVQEDGTGYNSYITPVQVELEKNRIGFEELLVQRSQFKVKLTGLKQLYDMLYQYNKLLFAFKSRLFNKTETYIKNAELVKEFLEDNSVPEPSHCASVYYKTKVQQEIMYGTFIQLLKISKPRLIWTYVYYDNSALALCRAANKQHIPVVEYQHSQQSDLHFAYSKWSEMDSYYKYFPSVFWVWSKEDADRVLKNFVSARYKPRIINGGNIAMIQKRQLHNCKTENAANGILVSLTGGWIPGYLEKIIIEDTKYTWYFRLHPRYPQDKETLMEFKNKFPLKVETDLSNKLPLYELFNYVCINITDFSGTALEGEYFDVKSIITSDHGKFIYKAKIDAGCFYEVSDEKEMRNVLYERENPGLLITKVSDPDQLSRIFSDLLRT